MDRYYIKRFRYDKDHIYLDLYCDETGANFELTFVNCNKIKLYKDILNKLSLCCNNKISINMHTLIKVLEIRRKEINNEKS